MLTFSGHTNREPDQSFVDTIFFKASLQPFAPRLVGGAATQEDAVLERTDFVHVLAPTNSGPSSLKTA